MQAIELEKMMGTQEKTLADYRKDFKIVKDGDYYVITGYKSENAIVEIPETIKGVPVKIKSSAFDGRENEITILASEGSYAQKFAKKHHIQFQTI